MNKEFLLWDAIVQWRDHICKSDFYRISKCNYLTGMLKLLESRIVNANITLETINDTWMMETKKKISEKLDLAITTRKSRKKCLSSLYKFIQTGFDSYAVPYGRHPSCVEIEYILSYVWNKETEDINPDILYEAVSKINKRDADIIWILMNSGKTLDKILDLKRHVLKVMYIGDGNKLCYAYLDFGNGPERVNIPSTIVGSIRSLNANTKMYLFETAANKRILRTQILRTLKKAGYAIGLTYDLYPSILYRYACVRNKKYLQSFF